MVKLRGKYRVLFTRVCRRGFVDRVNRLFGKGEVGQTGDDGVVRLGESTSSRETLRTRQKTVDSTYGWFSADTHKGLDGYGRHTQ